MKKSLVCLMFTIISLVLAGGCGYRVGSSLPPGIKSVHIPAFINKSGEPLLETLATSAALQEFQRDGTLEVADPSFADTVLTVTITRYGVEPVRFEQDNRKTAAEYRMRIDAEYVFSKISSQEVLQKGRVFGETLFEPGSDLPSSKRSAVPDACEDLAHQVVKAVVEYW